MPRDAAVEYESPRWNDAEREWVREHCTRGYDDKEMREFEAVCRRRGLDPMAGHIHGKKYKKRTGGYSTQFETKIEGLRALAERTGRYGGGPAPVFEVIPAEESFTERRDLKATVTVRKLCGTAESGFVWMDVTEVAYFHEYCKWTTDQDGKRVPEGLWRTGPHFMLSKCAEARALRRAFPELGGLYIDDEMQQADNWKPEAVVRDATPAASRGPDEFQIKRFKMALAEGAQAKKDERILADLTKRANEAKTSDGFNVVCDELEAYVGLSKGSLR